MAEYQNRARRIEARFRVSFAVDGAEISGNCMNISESGLLGSFSEALELWSEGELTVHFGEGALGIKARVARAMDTEAGLVFLSERAADREAIAAVIASAQATMGVSPGGESPPF